MGVVANTMVEGPKAGRVHCAGMKRAEAGRTGEARFLQAARRMVKAWWGLALSEQEPNNALS